MPINFDLYGLPPAFLDGNLTAALIDSTGTPNRVLERNQPCSIKVDWSINGPVAPGLGGDWRIQVFMESMGPGPELSIGTTTVPLNSVPPAAVRNYTATLNIPGGTVPADGTYKLTLVLTHTNLGVPDRMAGFVEGPVVQFYTP